MLTARRTRAKGTASTPLAVLCIDHAPWPECVHKLKVSASDERVRRGRLAHAVDWLRAKAHPLDALVPGQSTGRGLQGVRALSRAPRELQRLSRRPTRRAVRRVRNRVNTRLSELVRRVRPATKPLPQLHT